MEGKLNILVLAVLLILVGFRADAVQSSSDWSESRPDLPGHRNCERVKCESWQFKYNECSVRPSVVISRVTVRDKISHSSCLFSGGKPPNGDDTNGEGIYGFHENTVWVHWGCRAVFDVCLSGQSGTCRQVKCESWNYQYAECNVDENKEIKEVTMFDRLSVSECAHQQGNIAPEGYRKGQTGIYGYSGNTLWVHRGCRAWFDVCFSDGTCNLDCKNGGKCTTDGNQQKCVCPHGYTGSLCEVEQKNCEQVQCESWNYQYNECSVKPSSKISTVTVHDKVSRSACLLLDGKPPNADDTEGEGLYGFHGNTLWVHRGCRALFDVCFSGQSGTCRQIKCESWNYEYAECNVLEHREIEEVTVDDRVSVSECVHQEGNIAPEGYMKGQTGIYGYSADTLWVHRGCRAWFKVCFSDAAVVEVPENLPLESVASLHRNVKLIIIVAPIIGFVVIIAIVLAVIYWYRHQSSHLTNPPRTNRPLQYENNLYATVDSLAGIIPEKNIAVLPENLPVYSPDLKNGEYTYEAPPAYQEKGAV